ncbi:MAG TPA: tetratricopeptide repeat protein [Thermoanaerobaculia bacterium]|nr:tetratricopeptide repeat protein [Thermoanaerobaculia bacterium]
MRAHSVLLAAALALVGSSAPAQERPGPAAQSIARYRGVIPRLGDAAADLQRMELARAEKTLKSILTTVPEFSDAHFLMARVLYAQRRYPEALASIERAKETFGSTAAMMAGAREERKAELIRQKSEQMTLLTRASGPTAGAIRQKIGIIEVELSQLGPVEVTEIPAPMYFVHANVLLRLGKAKLAVEQYQEALRIDPKYGDAANNLASLYYDAKLYERARQVIVGIESNGGAVTPALKSAVMEKLAP